MTKTDITALADQLKSMTAKQLQQLLMATPNRDGSEVRAKRNARTQAYFDRIREQGLYPYKYDTFTQFREVVE